MSKKHYLVIILDVNSIPRESPVNDVDENSLLYQHSAEDESQRSPAQVGSKAAPAIPYKYQAVKSIKETVITLLAKASLHYHAEEFNFSQVFWSFKLYNSSYEINSKAGRSFQPISVESIDAFEKQLDSYLDTSSQSALKADSKINKIQFLSTSLKSVIGDLPWPEPNNGFRGGLAGGEDYNNVIYALFRVPATEAEVQAFIPNWTPASGSKAIMNDLLPKAFCRKLKDLQIQLNFLDLWPAFDDKRSHEIQSEMETSRPLAKIVHFLQGGITTFTHISQGVPLELPSYAALVKLLIAANTQTLTSHLLPKSGLDETQKTLLKLHGSLNGSIVKAPNEDTDGESIRSNHGVRIPISNPSYALSKHQRRSCPENLQHKVPVNPIDDRHHRWAERVTTSGGRSNHSNARRFSDERDRHRRHPTPLQSHFHDEIPKKRKYEFEEDMVSEEGYSPNDIENWCIDGKVGVKDRHPHRKAQPHDKGHRYSHQHPGKYTSPLLLQPQKRMRREREEMAPPMKMHSVKHRYSDPTSAVSYQAKVSNNNDMSLRTRGQLMVNKGLRQKTAESKMKEKARLRQETQTRPQTNCWKPNERTFSYLKSELQMCIQQPSINDTSDEDDILPELTRNVNGFMDAVVQDESCCLPSTAQVLVTTVGATLVDHKQTELRTAMEKILLVPYETLNLHVLKFKNKSTQAETAVFRSCLLQILINFEMLWTLPVKDMPMLEERFIEDVTRILHLIRVYRKEPPIEDFVNDVLVPIYHNTHAKLLRDIAATMNISLTSELMNNSFDSLCDSSSNANDDCSVSSVNSSMCGPEDSTSQHPHDSSYNQMNQSQNSQRTSLRTASFLSVNNPKRAIMLPVAKLPVGKPKIYHKSHLSQSTQSGSLKPTKNPKPKKVRRNLFDVQASRDPKDMKMLLNLATTNASSFSRSPSLFKSPISKMSCSPRSPGRPSPFFALARAASRGKSGRSSRRRLVLDLEEDEADQLQKVTVTSEIGGWGTISHSPNENALCPESPYTPKLRAKITPPGSKHSSTGATSTKSVVKESPEVAIKSAYSGVSYKHSSRRIDSVSFYSSGNESLKARAWERSGAKLMAAKMRDSVDLSQSLMSDLEYANNDSPNKPGDDITCSEKKVSPVPCSSKTNYTQHFEFGPLEEVEPNIRALLCNEIVSSPNAILNSNLPAKSSGFDTPSKRVHFTVELVSTPSPTTPGRNNSGAPITPKSILKDAGNTHSNTNSN